MVLLGGGSGGYVAAVRAAQLGMKTAVVEEEKLGGTCLHRGCIPTKVLLRTAELMAAVQDGAAYGMKIPQAAVDYPALIQRKTKIVDQLHRGIQFLMKKNAVTVLNGRGRLRDAHTVEVMSAHGSQTIQGKNLVIATGSTARSLPGVPFGPRVLSSDGALELTAVPQSIVIIGAGAVGCEFASLYHDFGTRVTLLEAAPTLLPLEDQEIGPELGRIFTRRGIAAHAGARVDLGSIRTTDASVTLEAEIQGKVTRFEADYLLVAVGRAPRVEDVGLETTGVKLGPAGTIQVDARQRTGVEGVWAIGDVVGGYQLAHVAAHEGVTAVEDAAGIAPDPMDPNVEPRATYCRPEVGSVGLSEKDARAQGHEVSVGKFPFRANGRALIHGDPDGFVKVVADTRTNDILGVHILGPSAADLIAEATLAKFLDATPLEVGHTIHPHPTLTETVGEAALGALGIALNI